MCYILLLCVILCYSGEKLPVLTEEQADKEVNSNGSSPRLGGWGNLMAGKHP